MAQYKHKVGHPNDNLPTKFEEGKGYDKAMFTTPYTVSDAGQQPWGGWSLTGQQEWAKMKKAIKAAKKKMVPVEVENDDGEEEENAGEEDDGKTFEMRHVDKVEEDFLKLLLDLEKRTDPPAPKAAKAKPPTEREKYDPNADSDDEDDANGGEDDDKGEGKDDKAAKGDDDSPKGDDDSPKGEKKDNDGEDEEDKPGNEEEKDANGEKTAPKRRSSRHKEGQGGGDAKKPKTK